MAIVLWYIRKDSAHLKKNIHFKVPATFWNWPTKNIPDQQKRVAFRKSQKSAKSLHPTVDPGGKKLKQHHNKARKLVPVPVR